MWIPQSSPHARPCLGLFRKELSDCQDASSLPFRRTQLFCSEWVITIYLQPPNWCVCWHWFPMIGRGLAQTYDSQDPSVMSPAHMGLLQALSRSPHIFSSSIIMKTTRCHVVPHTSSSFTYAPLFQCGLSLKLSLSLHFPQPVTSTFASSSVVLNLGHFSPPENTWQCLGERYYQHVVDGPECC